MPLTDKGKKIMKSMQKQYGKKKAEEVFYASKNAGKITGVDKTMKAKKGKIIKANEGKFSEKFEMPNYEYERRKGSPEILIPKGPKKFERDADDPKRMERFREERPIGKLPKSRKKEIEDILKRTPKDPKPPKQKIEFDEAKKGKMIKAAMGILTGPITAKYAKKSQGFRDALKGFGLTGMAASSYLDKKYAEDDPAVEQKTAKAKKGKIMSRKSGSPKKGENAMMKQKQKLFKEIDQAEKSLKPKKLKGGGAAIRGMNFKGVF